MITKNLTELGAFMQVILKLVKLMPVLVRLVKKGKLFEAEKMIEKFVYKEFVPTIYENIFKEAEENLEKGLKQKAKHSGYTNLRTRKTKFRTIFGIEIETTTVHGKKENDEQGTNLTHSYLGIKAGCSPYFMSDVVSTGLYAPSFQVASEILATRGIEIDDNKIASLTYKIAEIGMKHRGKVSFEEGESFAGKRVIIGLDGGRIRTRKQKKGRKKKTGSRGYHAERREVKSLVIAVLNDEGKVEKSVKPFYDACIGTPKEFFEILALYLISGEIGNAEHVCVVADGATRIREGVQEKLDELGVSTESITEVLDYSHAVSHLSDFLSHIKSIGEKEKKRSGKSGRRYSGIEVLRSYYKKGASTVVEEILEKGRKNSDTSRKIDIESTTLCLEKIDLCVEAELSKAGLEELLIGDGSEIEFFGQSRMLSKVSFCVLNGYREDEVFS